MLWAPLVASVLTVEPIALEYVGVEPCATEEQLRTLVLERLGEDPFATTAPRLARVEIRRVQQRFEATLTVVDVHGSSSSPRRIASARADCADLGPALAFALSIAVDPVRALKGPPDAGPAEPPPPDAGTPPPPPPPEPADAGVPVPWRLFFGAGGHAAAGAAPSINGGALLVIGAERGAFGLHLEGRADFPGRLAFEPGEVSAQLLTGTLAGCFAVGLFRLCPAVSGGVLRAEGTGFAGARVTTTPYFAAGARVALVLLFSQRFGLFARIDAMAPLTRTVLRVGASDAWSTPALNASLGLMAAVFLE